MTDFKSGFVCFVGRPNAGKSTLINKLVGQKVAITSSKPQTTRHTIRGVVNRVGAQIVIIDTPGVSKPRSLLQTRLNDLVYATWSQVDIVCLVFPSNEHIGPGDEYLANQLANLKHRPKIVALATKTDLVSPQRLAKHLLEISDLEQRLEIRFSHIVPCSALEGDQLDDVENVLVSLLEPGPKFYPDDDITDEVTETLIAELVREAALEDLREELPHSIAVEVDEILEPEDDSDDKARMDIFASIVVERDSQKGIIIGKGGAQIRRIRLRARRQIQALLGTKVRLDLKVKVLKDWQRSPKYLKRLGY